MDIISHLPDDVLLKILSFLRTKDVMRTMFLSKRWESLWMFVPRLEFDDTTHFPTPPFTQAGYNIFRQFVDRSLMSFEGQVLQSLYLKLDGPFAYEDVTIWVKTAVKRGLVELKLQYSERCWRLFLPKSLYKSFETIVVLKLEEVGLDFPNLVCLRSLKTLFLKSVIFSSSRSLLRLLPKCPVLEDLYIEHRPIATFSQIFRIEVPTLKRLSLNYDGIYELDIDAQSLKYLYIKDRSRKNSFCEIKNINDLVKVNIEVILRRPEELLHSLTSAEHMRLCLSYSEVVYPVGSCFPRLKHLEVCSCKSEWLYLFMRLLKDSPSLKVIKINQNHNTKIVRPEWYQPRSVPTCLPSSLEILEWDKYRGFEEEKELSTYILKNAICLKKASFIAKSIDDKEKLHMLQKLSFSPRVSSTCELVFT
ncbi:hypothetical protein CARUB_v10028133mg [Capsella rubella]|uniref:F-box domain-containing protein n=1 Tax=Capsella rubella TaxID=81985 RepID=R0GUF0_9BRAS|nr:FBD-associated F-box protein At5g56380 [Capsella rubella]EOA14823.1 hypothetical protein CARUB_v10028133mg [Capsella rubella]